MAMSKDDYVAIGTQQFIRGEARPLGNSWQSKAMQQGYDCAQIDAHDYAEDVKQWDGFIGTAESGKEAPKKESEGGSSLKASEPLESCSQNDSNVERNKGLVKLFRDAAGITKREQEECGHNAIVSHIQFLRNEAMHCDDPKRTIRLINKADKLHFKHQYLIG